MDVPTEPEGAVRRDASMGPDASTPAGALLLGLGAPCGSGADCQSGFCADGVCCQSACADPCFACNLPGAAGTCTPKPPTALVGHWRFDETAGSLAADGSCSGNDGELMRFSSPGWTTGKIMGALRFDGVATWVKVPRSASLDAMFSTNQFAISAWVWLEAQQSMFWSVIASRQHLDTSFESFTFGFRNGYLRLVVASDLPGTHACSAATSTRLNRWVHVAGTFDGQIGRLYMDGVEVCNVPRPVALGSGSGNPIIIGGNANDAGPDPGDIFQGTMDDLVFYSRALSSSEIQALAAGGEPPRQ
jgi:hypothetical protein